MPFLKKMSLFSALKKYYYILLQVSRLSKTTCTTDTYKINTPYIIIGGVIISQSYLIFKISHIIVHQFY